MRVDDFLQFGEVGSGRAAFEIDDAADIVEAGADAFLYREKAAQIERPFELDGDAIERDAERGGISPRGDFLACSERCQDELDRIRTRVRSAEARRFVDGHGELSDFRSLRSSSTWRESAEKVATAWSGLARRSAWVAMIISLRATATPSVSLNYRIGHQGS